MGAPEVPTRREERARGCVGHVAGVAPGRLRAPAGLSPTEAAPCQAPPHERMPPLRCPELQGVWWRDDTMQGYAEVLAGGGARPQRWAPIGHAPARAHVGHRTQQPPAALAVGCHADRTHVRTENTQWVTLDTHHGCAPSNRAAPAYTEGGGRRLAQGRPSAGGPDGASGGDGPKIAGRRNKCSRVVCWVTCGGLDTIGGLGEGGGATDRTHAPP